MAEFAKLRYSTAEGIATIALDDPDTRNALSDELLSELLVALRTAKADDDVRVVVLASTHDKVFSAGGNLAGSRPTRRPRTSGSAPGCSRRSSASSASSASRRSWPRAATSLRARWGSRSPAT
jgi:enoyl-CoA hydratase/carnithine racemase